MHLNCGPALENAVLVYLKSCGCKLSIGRTDRQRGARPKARAKAGSEVLSSREFLRLRIVSIKSDIMERNMAVPIAGSLYVPFVQSS